MRERGERGDQCTLVICATGGGVLTVNFVKHGQCV